MRRVLLWPVLAFAVVASRTPAADQPGASSAIAPPQFSTEIRGTVPDLAGRWLAVARMQPTQVGAVRVNPADAERDASGGVRLWDIKTVDGKPQLTLLWRKLPDEIEQSMATAGKAGRIWEPTEAELREVRDRWDTLPPTEHGVSRVDTVIMGKDDLTPDVQREEHMKEAQFVIQLTARFAPGSGRPMADVLLYGVTQPIHDGFLANYTSASVAPAPLPIGIQFEGTAHLYRLDAVPARGLLDRIFGIFAGCGRSSGRESR